MVIKMISEDFTAFLSPFVKHFETAGFGRRFGRQIGASGVGSQQSTEIHPQARTIE